MYSLCLEFNRYDADDFEEESSDCKLTMAGDGLVRSNDGNHFRVCHMCNFMFNFTQMVFNGAHVLKTINSPKKTLRICRINIGAIIHFSSWTFHP